MIKIAHRGNFAGRLEDKENQPDYILRTLDLGFDVEVDVWLVNDQLFLGHDKPEYPIEYSFLMDTRLWIHCKNLEVANLLSQNATTLNLFLHTEGTCITTQGFLWTAPGGVITSRSIAVMPELTPDWDISGAIGVCTDYPMKYMLL
jgi:hypothetical protein